MTAFNVVSLTNPGKKRSTNQDYLGDLILRCKDNYSVDQLVERGYLFAVADGVGGHAGGDLASTIAIHALFGTYYEGHLDGSLTNTLVEAINEANLTVWRTAFASKPSFRQMATTLSAVLIENDKATFANVGDSRGYFIRHGIIEQVTHDHSMVQELMDAGRMSSEEVRKSNIRNFITRAIGRLDDFRVDLFERKLEAGDIILLCSDGLYGQVEDVELSSILALNPDINRASEVMVELANQRGGPDNISVLIVQIL